MNGERHGCADTRPLHALVVVEGPPLGAHVDEVLIDDQAALVADELGPLVVVDKLARAALGAFDDPLFTLGLLGLLFRPLEGLLPGDLFSLYFSYFFYLCHDYTF